MLKLISRLQSMLLCRRGATAIEYGLIAAGIAVAIVVIVFTVGDQLLAVFTTVSTKLQGAATPVP